MSIEEPNILSTRDALSRHLSVLTSITLMLVAVSEGYTLLNSSENLSGPDPVFSLFEKKTLLFLALIFESLLGFLIVYPSARERAGIGLLWFSGWILLYRFGHILNNSPKPCGCLGALFERIGLSFDTQRIIAGGFLVLWIITGSFHAVVFCTRNK